MGERSAHDAIRRFQSIAREVERLHSFENALPDELLRLVQSLEILSAPSVAMGAAFWAAVAATWDGFSTRGLVVVVALIMAVAALWQADRHRRVGAEQHASAGRAASAQGIRVGDRYPDGASMMPRRDAGTAHIDRARPTAVAVV